MRSDFRTRRRPDGSFSDDRPELIIGVPGRMNAMLLEGFRLIEHFRSDYDQKALGELEGLLMQWMPAEAAQGAVSDMLLIDHELRWRMLRQPEFLPVGSRFSSMFERRLIALLAAEQRLSGETTTELVANLGLRRPGIAMILCRKLALRLLKAKFYLIAQDDLSPGRGGAVVIIEAFARPS